MLLASTAFAGEKEANEMFARASKDPVSEAGRGRMAQAITEIESEGGARSVAILGKFLRETFRGTEKLLAEMREIKKQGALAFGAVDKLGREVEQLKHRRDSGATDLDAEIEEREAKIRRAVDEFEKAKYKSRALGELVRQWGSTRQACARACSRILARVPSAQVASAVESLRASTDLSADDQSLLLVWILRRANRPEASPALLDIFGEPKTPAPTRVEAACAVAALGDLESMRALVDRLDRLDEVAHKRVLAALSLAAHKRLSSLDEVKAWLADAAKKD